MYLLCSWSVMSNTSHLVDHTLSELRHFFAKALILVLRIIVSVGRVNVNRYERLLLSSAAIPTDTFATEADEQPFPGVIAANLRPALTQGWERDCFEQDLSSPAVLSHLLLNLRLKIQGHKGKKTTINWVKLIERIFSPTVWLEHDCPRLSTIHNVGPPSYVIIRMFLHGMQVFFKHLLL